MNKNVVKDTPAESLAQAGAADGTTIATAPQGDTAVREDEPPPALDFADVIELEYQAITGLAVPDLGSTAGAGTPTPEQRTHAVRRLFFERGTTALCLSGGGIRSASFCLGVVQGLAKKGLLHQFDYLSTVSGGGYIGGMLAAWIYRSPNGVRDVESALADPRAGQVDPVGWLRTYLSYLSPRRGLFSIDAWTLFATYLRNLLLNSLVLLPVLALLVLVPFALTAALDYLTALALQHTLIDLLAVSVFLFGLGWVVTATKPLRVMSVDSARGAAKRKLEPNEGIQASLILGSIALCFGWVLLLLAEGQTATFWSEFESALRTIPHPGLQTALVYKAIVLFVFFWALLDAVATRDYVKAADFTPWFRRVTLVVAFVCGLVTSLLAFEVLKLLTAGATFDEPALRRLLALGPPGLLASIGIGEILFVGAVSKWADDYDREWSARAGAWTTLVAITWLALFGIAFYGPEAIRALGAKIGDGAYWALLVGAGAVIARIMFRTESTEGREQRVMFPRLRDRGLDFFALLFVFFLFVGIAYLVEEAVHMMERFNAFERLFNAVPLVPRHTLPFSGDAVSGVAGVLMLVMFAASACVNINKFSLHSMYRDRLIRAFLGASRGIHVAPSRPLDEGMRESRQFEPREANAFTRFDRDDNPILHWLAPRREGAADGGDKKPFLLMNAALNLVRTSNLAWQERRAASFTFSALHTGSHLTGYRPTAEMAAKLGGLTLGTAMATSGAAVSPNAGYISSPLRTFVLALFNARLGWWLGHPAKLEAAHLGSPRIAVLSLVRELLGLTHDSGDWIFVSDGGHFDNLGLYEAVQRGCRCIVAVDSSCDRRWNFDDLGNAIRKIRIDLGVPIEQVGRWQIGERLPQEAGRVCALFRIRYDLANGGLADHGDLLYIKPAFYPDAEGLPMDVLQYAGRSPNFPHETTADQFFTESQFESYRALGEYELDAIAGANRHVKSVAELIRLAGVHLDHSRKTASDMANPALDPRVRSA